MISEIQQHIITSTADSTESDISLISKNTPILHEWAKIINASNLKMVIRFSGQSMVADISISTFSHVDFFSTSSNGEIISHDLWSYGQKRLLSFLYYLECNPNIVIADELVNGLHHSWIEAAMKKLETRQSFLTSQNPLLLDYLPTSSLRIYPDRLAGQRNPLVTTRLPRQLLVFNLAPDACQRGMKPRRRKKGKESGRERTVGFSLAEVRTLTRDQ